MSTLTDPTAKREAVEAELMTYRDVAGLLQVCEKSVYRNPPPGRVTIGRSVRFVAAEVRRWVAAGCPVQNNN